MNRSLWTVLADRRPVAVVAAARLDEAWAVVDALADHDDLPPGRHRTDIMPCPPKEAARIMRRAIAAQVADRFVAYITGGLFVTFLGGLSLPTITSPAAKPAA